MPSTNTIFRKINRRFTKDEDELLKKLVQQYGDKNWLAISKQMPKRNSRQCKDRWFQYLCPTTNLTPWSLEELQSLEELVVKYNYNWTTIAKFFNNRPPSQVRNKWKLLQYRKDNNLDDSQFRLKTPNTVTPQTEIEARENQENQFLSNENLENPFQEIEIHDELFTFDEFNELSPEASSTMKEPIFDADSFQQWFTEF